MVSIYLEGKKSTLDGVRLVLNEDKTGSLYITDDPIEIEDWGLYDSSKSDGTIVYTLKRSNGLYWLFFRSEGDSVYTLYITKDMFLTFKR